MVIVQHDMTLERNIYKVLLILWISSTEKTYLEHLFDISYIKNVKVFYGYSELTEFV